MKVDITQQPTLRTPAIPHRHDEETHVLHALERDFKRPGVYKRPISSVRLTLEWVSLCIILLCLMLALAVGTVLNPWWHFRSPLEPSPVPTQVQCVHVTIVTDDHIHWTAVRNYQC